MSKEIMQLGAFEMTSMDEEGGSDDITQVDGNRMYISVEHCQKILGM